MQSAGLEVPMHKIAKQPADVEARKICGFMWRNRTRNKYEWVLVIGKSSSPHSHMERGSRTGKCNWSRLRARLSPRSPSSCTSLAFPFCYSRTGWSTSINETMADDGYRVTPFANRGRNVEKSKSLLHSDHDRHGRCIRDDAGGSRRLRSTTRPNRCRRGWIFTEFNNTYCLVLPRLKRNFDLHLNFQNYNNWDFRCSSFVLSSITKFSLFRELSENNRYSLVLKFFEFFDESKL